MKKKITLFLTIAFLSSLHSNAKDIKPLVFDKEPLGNLVECTIPTNIIVTDITSTSANFSWTPTPGGNLNSLFYQYCVVTSQTPEDGPTNFTGVTGSSYFTLTSNTTYYVYVRSFCEGGVWSDWSQPVTFTTSILNFSDFAFKGFSAYPNPADNFVRLSNNISIDSVEIFNAIGQSIFSQKYNDLNVEVNLVNLSQGAYFMTVHSGGYAKTIQLIKK
jgi:hypothetical protein